MKRIFLAALLLLGLVSCDHHPSSTLSYSKPSTSPSQDISISSSHPGKENGQVAVYCINDTHGAMVEDKANYQLGMAKISGFITGSLPSGLNRSDAVVLSAGDMFQGNAYSALSKGESMVAAMNATGFDAMAVGNHEFDWGVDRLIKLQEKADFPFLAYNIYEKSSGEPVSWTKPSVVLTKGGFRVGVIGEIGDLESSISYSMIKNYSLEPDPAKVNVEAKRLREDENCDVVILLTHNAPNNMYNRLDPAYVDLILGGHDHTRHDQYYNGIRYIENGANGGYVGRIVFNIRDGEATISECHSYGYREVGTAPDPAVQSVVDAAVAEADKTLKTEVGSIDTGFSRINVGDLVTRAMHEYAVENYSEEKLTDLVAIHNTGGVRANLDHTAVTYGDIYTALPFDNDVRLLKVSGTNLISSLKAGHYYYTDIDIVASKTYNVVTISYLCEDPNYPLYAADGGILLSKEPVYTRDIVAEYMKKRGTLSASDYSYSGRNFGSTYY